MGCKILLVDDEDMLLKAIKRMIVNLGHSVDVANNGPDAMELLKISTYDILILDHGMPNMNGFQVLELIKGKYPHMRIILFSGNPQCSSLEQRLKYGIDDVLNKPVDNKQLNDILLNVQ